MFDCLITLCSFRCLSLTQIAQLLFPTQWVNPFPAKISEAIPAKKSRAQVKPTRNVSLCKSSPEHAWTI